MAETKESLDAVAKKLYPKGLNKTPDIAGVLNMTMWNKSSGNRLQMFSASHSEQAVMLREPESPKVFTGFEKVYGQFANSMFKAPSTVKVISVVNKFIDENGPVKKVYVVQDVNTGVYDVYEISRYESLSERHGYIRPITMGEFKKPGDIIQKDELIYKSENHDEFDNYRNGKNFNVCYISEAENEEDGILISETVAENTRFTEVDTIEIPLNINDVLLNMYGSEDEYKSIPDLGEHVMEGILAVKRKINHSQAPSEMTSTALRNIISSDSIYYAHGRVIDIDIFINNTEELFTNSHRTQLASYYARLIRYHKDLYDVLNGIVRKKTNHYSHKLWNMCNNSAMYLDDNPNKKFMGGSSGMFELGMIRITTVREKTLTKGYKLTNRHGAKGVICGILPDEMMPMDVYGNRADVILSPPGVVGRSNPAQNYEHELNFIAEAVRRKLLTQKKIDKQYKMIIDFLKDVNPQQAELLDRRVKLTAMGKEQIVANVIEEGFYIHQAPFENISYEAMKKLYKKYKVAPDKITRKQVYPDGKVRTLTSERPVIIAPAFFMVLYHTTESKFSARSLGSTSSSGIQTRAPKGGSSFPFGDTPIKFGEMENMNAFLRVDPEIVHRFMATMGGNPKLVEKLSEMLLEEDPFEYHDLELSIEDLSDDVSALALEALLFSGVGVEACERLED